MPVLANVIEITDYSDLSVMYVTIACIIYIINCTVSNQKIKPQLKYFKLDSVLYIRNSN